MTAVSTQTSLSCPGYDNLLPQALLFNLVTTKVAEAFQLANTHANSAHYKDDLVVKQEAVDAPHYRPCPSLRANDAHLDLVFPSTKECFSPEHYKPPKRQRLNSLPHTRPLPTEKISFTKTLGLQKKAECSVCVEGFENKELLDKHLKVCPKYLKKSGTQPPPPKSAVCKSLNWESLDPLKSHVPSQSMTETKEVSQKTGLQLTANGEIPEGIIVEHSMAANEFFNNPASRKAEQHQKDEEVQRAPNVQKSSNVFNQHNPTEKVTQMALQIHRKVITKTEPASSPEPTVKVESPPSPVKSPQGGKRRRVQSRKARESKSLEKELEEGEQRKKSCEGEAEAAKEVKRKGRPSNKDKKKVTVKVNVKKELKVTAPTPGAPKTAAFQCSECTCFFTSRWTMKRHEYTIHGIGTPLTSDDVCNRQVGTECPDCADRAQSDSAEYNNLSPNNLNCEVREDVPSPSKLNTILQSMRDQTDSKPDEWLCGCCGLRFKSRVLLKRHAKSHRDKTEVPQPGPDGKFMCYICVEKFATFRKLLNHQTKHAYRPKCAVCQKTFPLISMLKNHKCVKELVQVNCRHCALTFHSAIEASRHMSTEHAKLQNVMASTVCRFCDYTFSSSTKYLIHKSISHPTPDFHCFLCNKLYGDRKGLEHHCTTYHNTKPYICTVCEDGFDVLGNLQGHKSEKHFGAAK